MRSVERPRRLAAAAACALALALGPGVAAADGLDPLQRGEAEHGALFPVSFTLDLAAAERVQVRALIASVAQRYGVDGALLLGIAECESQLNPRATGPDGAAGLFQVIPSTWSWVTGRLGLSGASPHDPVANAEVAAWLLANLGPRQWACP
jgi:soluble lytic murein transglycosylase-like protein